MHPGIYLNYELSDPNMDLGSQQLEKFTRVDSLLTRTFHVLQLDHLNREPNLILPSFSLEEDPLSVMMKRIKKKFHGPMLRFLFEDFLRENDIPSSYTSVELRSLRHRIFSIEEFKPHGWKVFPLIQQNSEQEFEFLKVPLRRSEESKRRKTGKKRQGEFDGRVHIPYNKSGTTDSMRDLLPLVCSRLGRSQADFFKMLLMFDFHKRGIVEDSWKLIRRGYKSKIDKLPIEYGLSHL